MGLSSRAKTPVMDVALGHAAVRNGDARAHAGGAQSFALDQGFENPLFRQTREARARAASSCSSCFLLWAFNEAMHRFRRKQVGDFIKLPNGDYGSLSGFRPCPRKAAGS